MYEVTCLICQDTKCYVSKDFAAQKVSEHAVKSGHQMIAMREVNW